MLVLFETPAGYALFKADAKKLNKADNVYDLFSTPEVANETCVPSVSCCQCRRHARCSTLSSLRILVATDDGSGSSPCMCAAVSSSRLSTSSLILPRFVSFRVHRAP